MADHQPVEEFHRHLVAVPDIDDTAEATDTADVVEPPAPDRGADPVRRPVDDGVRLRHVIGDVLREERRRQGRTLADVAEEAAVSLPYLSEIERGSKEVSSDVLHVVHTALGLELGEVLERSSRRLGTLEARAQWGGPLALAA
ncbi:MAG: helix-turn-helix transcriptional regulator [Actinomycetota bacterium]